MALFNFKKKKKDTPKARASGVSQKKTGDVFVRAGANVLVRPHITEKATFSTERGVYVFQVVPKATGRQIAGEVKRLFGVMPLRVNIVNLPSKRTSTRGRFGRKPGLKKAYVYLPKGKTIDIA